MAQLLDDSAIDDALVSLDGWRRVDNTIVRQVPVDGAAADRLETAVSKVADELDHHPVIDRADADCDSLCGRTAPEE
jgi:4a-hydroxytetrahydrobiopterin dehydratase